MKTVGDFKDAGLVFVEGDVFTCSEYIKSFTWRTNTGVKPEFRGLIEFTFNGEGCEMQEVRGTSNVNWLIVKKWRPSLNQSKKSPYDVDAHAGEAKPIFTQAMADNNELPPVGSEFVDAEYSLSINVTAIAHRHSKVVYEIGVDEFDREYLFASAGECKTIQTERERVTDKAALLIASKEALHNQYPKALAIAEILYDAGLLK